MDGKKVLHIQTVYLLAYQDDDLRALAKDCYFNEKSDPMAEPRHMLLTSGYVLWINC